jgi:molecular chaperone GrpE
MQETTDTINETPGRPDAELETAAGGEAGSDLERRLKQAEQAAQEHHDAWLRAKAESENFRKRSQTEIANAHKFALESFASELLPVKDSLEAALGSDAQASENMRAGVELTLRQLKAVFEKFNVREIDPLGQKFDPHFHQAISATPADADPNTVLQVLQKGYLLHDRVIRPALVIVSKAKGVES